MTRQGFTFATIRSASGESERGGFSDGITRFDSDAGTVTRYRGEIPTLGGAQPASPEAGGRPLLPRSPQPPPRRACHQLAH